MKIWIDAHISPTIATWLSEEFDVEATALRDLGLRDAEDSEILEAARSSGANIMTKDSDFAEMVERLGGPPCVIWLTCGNTSNRRLRQILKATFANAFRLLEGGESIVEISDA